ncbi:MAG: molybdopterin molybdotransferase MoeA [Deltaproteobacteria bacterium]|nr:molybdopterin molybdotransferase MoeA [Deltaproteobacteria bacterium]
MRTVEEAQTIVTSEIPRGPGRRIPLRKALGRVLAKDVFSPIASPSFDSSAMDGYAVCGDSKQLSVVAEIAAGDRFEKRLRSGEAARIMTGAIIPTGTTGVIPQEEVVAEDRKIFLSRKIERGENIRRCGEELKKGDLALSTGILLSPAAVGFLASLGIPTVDVWVPPRIAILSTGSELVRRSSLWRAGKVFESNSLTLTCALQEFSIDAKMIAPIPDVRSRLERAIAKALEENDFLWITGGVSVGRFDYVRPILEDLGVEPIFWKVAQRPGKPLFFGRKGDRFIFGLPGNPASSLVCYYEYARPALRRWLGFEDLYLEEEKARITVPLLSKPRITQFIRGVASRNHRGLSVRPAGDQGSHRMGTFAQANCLVVLPSRKRVYKKGDSVLIHWIPR